MDDIQKAVEGVMALRPSGPVSSNRTKQQIRKAEVVKKLSDLEFQREIEMIMNGEIPDYGAHFFTNIDQSRGPRADKKNAAFNTYPSKK
ncbi:TPA: hypothetical protein ACGU7J_001662 [Vibrio vulnificus]